MQRVVRQVLVVLLGIVIGVVAYVAYLIVTTPRPRDAVGWTFLAPLPSGRGETAAAVVDGRLYVIGGLTGLGGEATAEVAIYDPGTNAWEAAAPLPAARDHAAAAGLDGIVYVSGGGSGGTRQATLWALDSLTGVWQELPPMPETRFGHRMVAVGSRVYVVGGVGPTSEVLIYDPATDTWTTGAPMPEQQRNHVAAVAIEQEIWVIGGRSSGGNHNRVDIYDTETDSWRAGPPLPEPTSGATEAAIDGVIFVSGGEDPSGSGGVIDRHWQLDTQDLAAGWLPLSPPPLAVHGAHGAALDGRFLIVGGALRQGAFSRLSWTISAQAFRP
jgi:hypothetical protein